MHPSNCNFIGIWRVIPNKVRERRRAGENDVEIGKGRVEGNEQKRFFEKFHDHPEGG